MDPWSTADLKIYQFKKKNHDANFVTDTSDMSPTATNKNCFVDWKICFTDNDLEACFFMKMFQMNMSSMRMINLKFQLGQKMEIEYVMVPETF